MIDIIIDNKLQEKDRLMTAFNYMIRRNPDNQELAVKVLTYLRDELHEDIAPVLDTIHPTVPLIREQLVYKMTKANLESLIKAFSNTRSAMSLTMAESFLGEDATHEQILKNSCGIMHMLAELKYN